MSEAEVEAVRQALFKPDEVVSVDVAAAWHNIGHDDASKRPWHGSEPKDGTKRELALVERDLPCDMLVSFLQ